MATNLLGAARRQFRRGSGDSFIVVLGLIAANLTVLMAIWFALTVVTFDSDIPKRSLIYRVEQVSGAAGASLDWIAGIPLPLAEALPQTGLAYTAATRFFPAPLSVVPEKMPIEMSAAFVDEQFAEVFPINVLHGDLRAALKRPDAIAIDNVAATRLFGTSEALGKSLQIGDLQYVVLAVTQHRPSTSVPFEVLLPIRSAAMPDKWRLTFWQGIVGELFVELPPGVGAKEAAERLDVFYRTTPAYQELPVALRDGSRSFFKPRLVSLDELPLFGAGSNQTRYLLAALVLAALTVAVLAGFNFAMQSISWILGNQREIGIRKALGAAPRDIVIGVVLPALGVTLLAASIAVLIAALILPRFAAWLGQETLWFQTTGVGVPVLLAFAVCFGGLAAVYPAVIASRLNSSESLLGRGSSESMFVRRLRTVLVVFQVALTSGLLMIAFAVVVQARFLATADHGYDSQDLIAVDTPADMTTPKLTNFRDAVARIPGVESVGISRDIPGRRRYSATATISYATRRDVPIAVEMVGPGYFETYRIPMLVGRSFDEHRDRQGAQDSVILNPEATVMLGFRNPQEALGKVIEVQDGKSEVVGIASGVKLSGFRERPKPTLFSVGSPYVRVIGVRLNGRANVDAEFTRVWAENFPRNALGLIRVKEMLADQYVNELRLGTVISMASLIAGLVAALGIYAVVTHNVRRRLVDILIRKLYGATAKEILSILVRETATPLLIGLLIGILVGYVVSEIYLSTFPYSARSAGEAVVVTLCLVGALTVCATLRQFYSAITLRPRELLAAS